MNVSQKQPTSPAFGKVSVSTVRRMAKNQGITLNHRTRKGSDYVEFTKGGELLVNSKTLTAGGWGKNKTDSLKTATLPLNLGETLYNVEGTPMAKVTGAKVPQGGFFA